MSKIAADQVVEAYETMNLKVKRRNFFSSGDCACGLGAMWAKEFGVATDQYAIKIYNLFDDRFGKAYVNGFTNGFDGYGSEELNEDYIEGYSDGKAAYEAVLAKGLVVQE